MPKPRIWVVGVPINKETPLNSKVATLIPRLDEIWCEDTRVVGALLKSNGIDTKQKGFPRFVRMDAHQEREKGSSHLKRLISEGLQICIMSDAGQPGWMDPGAHMIEEARQFGIEILSCPGENSFAAFLSLAGEVELPYVFYGYFPRTQNDRVRAIQQSQSKGFHSWFEAPHRILKTLECWAVYFKSTSSVFKVVLAKEISKTYEKSWVYQTIEELDSHIHSAESNPEVYQKGEWVIGVQWKKPYKTTLDRQKRDVSQNLISEQDKSSWQTLATELFQSGKNFRQSFQHIKEVYDVSRDEAYRFFEQLKKKK